MLFRFRLPSAPGFIRVIQMLTEEVGENVLSDAKTQLFNLGVSKNRDTPKWMVKIMENPIKMDDLGENPLFLETSICFSVDLQLLSFSASRCERNFQVMFVNTFVSIQRILHSSALRALVN